MAYSMYLDRVRALTYLQTAQLCKTKNTRNISWQDLDAASIPANNNNIVVNEDGSMTFTSPYQIDSSFSTADPFSWEQLSAEQRGGSLYFDSSSSVPTAASVPYYITANNRSLRMIGQQSRSQTQTTNKWKPRPNLLFSLSSSKSPTVTETKSETETKTSAHHHAQQQQQDNDNTTIITDDSLDTLFLRMQLSSLPPGVDDEEIPEPLIYDTFFMSGGGGTTPDVSNM